MIVYFSLTTESHLRIYNASQPIANSTVKDNWKQTFCSEIADEIGFENHFEKFILFYKGTFCITDQQLYENREQKFNMRSENVWK